MHSSTSHCSLFPPLRSQQHYRCNCLHLSQCRGPRDKTWWREEKSLLLWLVLLLWWPFLHSGWDDWGPSCQYIHREEPWSSLQKPHWAAEEPFFLIVCHLAPAKLPFPLPSSVTLQFSLHRTITISRNLTSWSQGLPLHWHLYVYTIQGPLQSQCQLTLRRCQWNSIHRRCSIKCNWY